MFNVLLFYYVILMYAYNTMLKNAFFKCWVCWICSCLLLCFSFHGFDGAALLEYRSIQSEAPEFFYRSLKEDMHFPLLRVLKFSQALKQLE